MSNGPLTKQINQEASIGILKNRCFNCRSLAPVKVQYCQSYVLNNCKVFADDCFFLNNQSRGGNPEETIGLCHVTFEKWQKIRNSKFILPQVPSKVDSKETLSNIFLFIHGWWLNNVIVQFYYAAMVLWLSYGRYKNVNLLPTFYKWTIHENTKH